MKIKNNFQGLQYATLNIDKYDVEFDLLNSSEIAVCVDGFRIGQYDFIENKYINSEWYLNAGQDTFSLMTKRQQRLVLKYANKYFFKIYKDIYNAKLKAGKFFAPTQETIQNELYYINRIKKAQENIKNLEV